MAAAKGFTLIEIIVVLIIVGMLAAIAIPNLNISMEQTKVQAAKNNLLAILAAQSKYNEDYGTAQQPVYCTTTTGQVVPCTSAINNALIDTNLNLTITGNDTFHYNCTVAAGAIPYTCTATDGTVTLNLYPNAQTPAAAVNCGGTAGGVGNAAPLPADCTILCSVAPGGECPY